jgi:hypothetical protein
MVGIVWLHVCLSVAPFQFAEQFPVSAPANLQRMAVISLDDVDDDFAFQGEYLGGFWESRHNYRATGLQVVANGGGQYQAMRYDGGLPGFGADMRTPLSLQGSRDDKRLHLHSSKELIEVQADAAYVYRNQQMVARLAKVYRQSSTMGLAPPPHAQVLFGPGQTAPQFDKVNLADDGTLLAGGTTLMTVQDFHMHLEFRTPYMPYARGQSRGNSGVYVQRRYEIPILDSFGLAGAANECGGLYRQQEPDLNMCLPPLAWQTYDIYFTAARWDDTGATKVAPAVLTVFHNGVAVHYRRPLKDKTGAGRQEGPEPLPIYLQDHGNPVTFRNVWIVLEDENHGAVPCRCRPRPLARKLARIVQLARSLWCRG